MRVCDVSVVIPTYNRTSLLRRALNSVVQQTVQPSEVIIVDDCSEAAILAEVESLVTSFSALLNIKLIINDKNSGANNARNRGIFAAVGRYLAFLDSDDLWLPEKLERQVEEIERAKATSNKPVLSATGRYRVNGHGELIARQFGGYVLDGDKIRKSNFIGTLSSVVVETTIAREVHGFDEALPASQDWDFYIRLSEFVQYVGVAQPLCVYVDHDHDRITLDYRKKLRGHLAIYRNHIRHRVSRRDTIRGEFLRNIAEDYQELGKTPKAAYFFANALAVRVPVILLRPLVAFILRGSFWILPPPSLRQRRYQHYYRSMQHLLRDEKANATINQDRCTIQKLLA